MSVAGKITFSALALCAAAGLASVARAGSTTMTFTLGPTAPTATASDVSNLVGSTNDFGNVNTSTSGGYGGSLYGASGTYGNDQYQYVAHGRPAQGQTFTTGSNSTGYTLTDIWIQHPGYTSPVAQTGYNGTYWNLPSGGNLTLRITQPTASGLNVLQTETYTATGTENSGALWGGNSLTGDNLWLDFTLGTPVTLAANTQYGFDIGTSTANTYFEIYGTDGSATGYSFTGGNAYVSGYSASTGLGDASLGALSGSRVFLAALTPNAAVPEPTSICLLAAGVLGLLMLKPRKVRA